MLALLAMTILIGGCEKDNFEPPHEWLTGRLTYQGNTFYLDGNSTNGDDELIQFFQEGWGKYEGMADPYQRRRYVFCSLIQG